MMNSAIPKQDPNILVQRARSGDKTAFEDIFKNYWDMTYYYCLKILHNEYDAEDAAQEVFLMLNRRICNSQGPFLIEKNVKWDASSVCHKYIKRQRTPVGMEQVLNIDDVEDSISEERDEFLPSEIIEKEETHDQIMDMVEQLPQKQREAILLYYFNGFSQKEIAVITENTVGTVQKHLFRAKDALRKQVEKLMAKGERGMMAAVPVLTRLFYKEMQTIATADTERRIWQGVNIGLDAPVTNRTMAKRTGKTHGLSSNTAFGVTVGALAATAVICGIIGGINLYNNGKTPAVDAPVYQQSATLQQPDMISAFMGVGSVEEFNAFFVDYGLSDRMGAKDDDGNAYAICGKEYTKSSGEKVLFAAGYKHGAAGFELACQERSPESGLPKDISTWVNQNIVGETPSG